ncbi:MAG: glycosyltransferase family 4 protein [Dethiobacteria bacterium]|jgi:glycosyltransferase involved in cell wall biosynthesis
MKVLHLISGGDTGGAKTHVLSLAKELEKHVDIKLICLMEGDFFREGQRMGLNISVIPQKGRYDLGVVRQLCNLIRQERFQILHCHGARANFIAAIMRRSLHIPSLTTMHSDYKLDFQGSFYKNLIYTNLNAWALRSFDYFVAVSDSFKEMLVSRGFPAEKIFVIYNGIDFNAKLKLGRKEDILKDFGLTIPPEARIVGIMGRLHPVKGLDLFLQGARLVLEEEPDIYFLIAGDGEEKEKLIKLRNKLMLGERVYFTGYTNQPDQFISILDINTLTSYSESFPLVLLEGARLKKPTLSANVGGITHLLKEGETGLLFEAGNVEQFALKLLVLLRDEKLAACLGKKLYFYARENFSLERLGYNHREIYRQILKNAERGEGN